MVSNERNASERTGGNGSKRGFASMDVNRQREIASQGGKAAHKKGTAHEFDSEEARRAGKKGGRAAHEKGTAHQFNSEEAREAGRKGSSGNRGSSSSTPVKTSTQRVKADSQSQKIVSDRCKE